jgi:AAA+ ATPase superfamily predicted ATPase
MAQIIGRKKELQVLQKALDSNKAEMISVIGRRRVGKTFLIDTFYADRIVYSVTGTQGGPLGEQLENFAFRMQGFSKSKIPVRTPASWMKAFILLIDYLETLDFSEKKVIFLDELPWLSTHKSGFLRGLSFFWNSWAVKQNIVVVICGSAASWMIKKVVNHRGGLHNRITRSLILDPFSLAETEEYLQHKNLHFNRYHIIQMYMAMGGIPHYLEAIEKGESATENINRICFSKGALLRTEFKKLYSALFANADKHIDVIRTLSKKRVGITRQELGKNTKISTGGTLSRILEELQHSGFIDEYYPFGKKKKDKLIRLTDEYSLFYLKFIENNIYQGEDTWNHLSQTQAFKTWSGYAYENICLKHISNIKKALGITGIYSEYSSFYKKGNATKKGAQIDLVLDRNDQAINLFEIKFSNKLYSISKSDFENLTNKIEVFKDSTNTKKQVFLFFITTFGLLENQYSSAIVGKELTMDDLF